MPMLDGYILMQIFEKSTNIVPPMDPLINELCINEVTEVSPRYYGTEQDCGDLAAL